MIKNVSVPEGYKKTELGVIPEEWKVASLDKLAKIRRGASPRPIGDNKYFSDSGGRGWVRISDVTNAYKYLRVASQYLSELGSSKSVPVDKGDLIMSICATIGKPIIVDMSACIHDGFVLFSNLNEKIDTEFLFYVLSKTEQEFLKKKQSGTQGNLNTTIVGKTKIAMPNTIEEQQKIASILSKVDEQIEQTEQIIEKTEFLKKGLMQKLLTKGIGQKKLKKTEFGEIPEEWEVIGISKCCSEIFLGLTSKVDYVENDGIPLIRASDINKGYLSFDEARLISKEQHQKLIKYRCARRGDILISKSGSLGVCALVDTNRTFSIYESIIDLQPKREKVISEFLLWLMRDNNTQKRLLGNKVGSTVGHLNLIQFRSLKIVLPQLEEQQKIASILSKVDSQIQDNQSYLIRLQELKKGLMQDLLTGKVRMCV